MLNRRAFFKNVAFFSLLVVLPTTEALAKNVSKATIAASRQAVINLQIVEVLKHSGNRAFKTAAEAKVVNAADAGKFEKLYNAEVKSAAGRIADRLAKEEAQKFSAEQIAEILTASNMAYCKVLVASIINEVPTPTDIIISTADQEIFDRISSTDHFKTFLFDVTSVGGNRQRDVTILVGRTMAKLKAQ